MYTAQAKTLHIILDTISPGFSRASPFGHDVSKILKARDVSQPPPQPFSGLISAKTHQRNQ